MIGNLQSTIAAMQRHVTGKKVKVDKSTNLPLSDVDLYLNIKRAVEKPINKINDTLDIKVSTFEDRTSALHKLLDNATGAINDMKQQIRDMKNVLNQSAGKIRCLERQLALKNERIAAMKLKVQEMEDTTYDGCLIWKVAEFTKKQAEAAQGQNIHIFSPSFYSNRCGYKICACMYPNGVGTGKGSHLSVFFVVMRGSHDALQKWPFRQRVSFCLLNQTNKKPIIASFIPSSQSSSFQQSSTNTNIANGFPLFIELEVLLDPGNGFLREDTLFIKVAVDSNDCPKIGNETSRNSEEEMETISSADSHSP